MIVYTVHEREPTAADRIERAEALRFVRDGFSWPAAIFGPFWLLANRLWWETLAYLLVVAAIATADQLLDLPDAVTGVLTPAINILLGFEACSLVRWALERRGWQMVGTVQGRSRAECERRFFEGWLPTQPVLRPSIESARGRSGWAGTPSGRLTEMQRP